MEKNKQLVPKRRFKEFENDGEWEQKRLGDLGSVAMNKRIFKDQTSEDGDIPFYKIGTFGREPDAFISRELFEEYKSLYSYPEVGDILISASGSIGRTVEYTGEDEYFQDSNIVWLNHGGRINNLFLKQFYKIVEWQGLEGSTIKRLYNSNILDTEIYLPSLKEQKKIGLFFSHLDEIISLQQNKLNKIKMVKHSYLSDMFPNEGEKYPKKRFEGFTESWDLVKLSDISNVIGGGTPSTTNPRYWDGEIDWYSPTEIGNNIYTKSSRKKITKLGLEKSSANILPKDRTILFTSRASIGDMAILRNPGATNQGFQSLVLRDGVDIYFIYSMGYLIKKYAEKNASGSTFMEISGKNLEKMLLRIPSSDEQIKIGRFFKNLDKQIALEEQKLHKLKKLKQAYLNELFV